MISSWNQCIRSVLINIVKIITNLSVINARGAYTCRLLTLYAMWRCFFSLYTFLFTDIRVTLTSDLDKTEIIFLSSSGSLVSRSESLMKSFSFSSWDQVKALSTDLTLWGHHKMAAICRQYFQIHFFNKCICDIQISLKFVHTGPFISIDLNKGLVPNRRQAIFLLSQKVYYQCQLNFINWCIYMNGHGIYFDSIPIGLSEIY